MITLLVTGLTLLVLVILLFPVTISFNSVRSGGTIDGSLRVSWIIFLFVYALKEKQSEIHIFGRGIFHHKSTEKKPTEPEPIKERKKSRKMPHVKDFLDIILPMLRLFKDLVHAFRLKYIYIDVNFGLTDPANTGVLTGFMHAVRCSLKKEKNFTFTPDFTKQVLGWSFRSKVSFTPIKIVMPLVKFATNWKILRFALQNIT